MPADGHTAARGTGSQASAPSQRGGMSATAFKNAVRRREHYERSQPAARAKYGLLEKKKDYVERARNFHDKEKKLAQLRKKAQNRNPDEFYFKMVKAKTAKGVHRIEQANEVLKGDELRVFKTQDKGYVQTQRAAEEKVRATRRRRRRRRA